MQTYFANRKVSAYLISRSVNEAVANLPVSRTLKSYAIVVSGSTQ